MLDDFVGPDNASEIRQMRLDIDALRSSSRLDRLCVIAAGIAGRLMYEGVNLLDPELGVINKGYVASVVLVSRAILAKLEEE